MNRIRGTSRAPSARSSPSLLGFGVVFGVLAIGVDVGNLLW